MPRNEADEGGLPSPEGEGGSQRETDEVLAKSLIQHLSVDEYPIILSTRGPPVSLRLGHARGLKAV